MSQRTVRVNELIRREVSDVLHTDYQAEAVSITISEVDIAPDLRTGRVYYSVLGGGNDRIEAEAFFDEHGEVIRRKVGRRVVLKYLPHLKYIFDESFARGARTLSILDELDADEKA